MATTTIPWDDGSGDNITLTYTSASGNQTVTVSSDANTGIARTKTVTFSSAVGSIVHTLTVSQAAADFGTRLQYIGTNGGQYFDTGIAPKNTQNFELDAFVLCSSGGGCIWGARNQDVSGSSSSSNAYTLSVYINKNGFIALNDNGYDSGYLTSSATVYNQERLIKITNRALYVDTTLYKASGKTATYNFANTTVGLLKMHGTGNTWQTGTTRNTAARIYGFKIWDGDTLVRDFVPYRDENNVLCLFDTISGVKKYNIGSGSLVAGPEIGQTVPYITEEDITSDMLRYYKSGSNTRTCIPILISNVSSFFGTIANNSSLRIAIQIWDSGQGNPSSSSSNPTSNINSNYTVYDSGWINDGAKGTFSYAHTKNMSIGTAGSTQAPYKVVIVATYSNNTGMPTLSEIVNAIDLYFEK